MSPSAHRGRTDSAHRRRASRKAELIGAGTAAVAVGGALAVTSSAGATGDAAPGAAEDAAPGAAASTRRARAIAQLQKKHPGLDVSFTLPVMPEGLTGDGAGLLADVRKNGVKIAAVNIMAMDYGPACRGAAGNSTRPTCSSARQGELDFTKALAAYKG